MIDKRFPFLKPYALVLNNERQVREIISYPYPANEGDGTPDNLYVQVREPNDPTTMVRLRATSLTAMKPHEFQKRSDGFLYCKCGASENDCIHRSRAHLTMFTYTPNYRPPQFSGLPKGWELLETPHERGGITRADLPTSDYKFGLIGYATRLSDEQVE